VNPPALLALDRPTGKELWRIPLPHAPVASPAVRESTIYLATAAGLEARSLVDGAPLANWKLQGGPATGDFSLTRSHAAYVNAEAELILLRRENGSVEKRVSGLLPGSAPHVARDALLLAAKFQLLRLPLDGSEVEPLEWLDTAPLGRLTSPPILHGGSLYFGTSARGLMHANEPALE
jgi:outer membrane protein assembly factor BamB